MVTKTMRFCKRWILSLMSLGLLWACSAPPHTHEPSAPPATATPKVSPTAPQGKIALDDSYEILRNLEMVEYCLPYPKNEFKEDYDLAEYKGQHVLVSKDKQSKIIFSGNPVDMTLDALYAKCLADIASMSDASLTSKSKTDAGLTLVWHTKDQVHHLQKWYRAAAQETVTALFEYPNTAEEQFGLWIPIVVGHPTTCE
jgi:hypothetical protein